MKSKRAFRDGVIIAVGKRERYSCHSSRFYVYDEILRLNSLASDKIPQMTIMGPEDAAQILLDKGL